jgi:hypothetical protein
MITFIIIWWCILGMLACRILIVANIPDSAIERSGHRVIASYTMCAMLDLVLLILVLDGVEDKNFKLWK